MANTITNEVKTVKTTKRDYFNQLLNVVNSAEVDNAEELVTFINHEIELLNKKHSSKSGGSSKTAANVEIVFNALAALNETVTVTELQKASPALVDFSNQRISACLRILKDEGRVVKTTNKGKSYFAVVATVEDEVETSTVVDVAIDDAEPSAE